MFCQNCGNKIDENANFCTSCGCRKTGSVPPQDRGAAINQNPLPGGGFGDFKLVSLFNICSIFTAIMIVFIRANCNQVITERYALAFEDYFVISDDGKTWISLISALYALLSCVVLYFGKSKGERVGGKNYVVSGLILLLALAAVFIKLPAPY